MKKLCLCVLLWVALMLAGCSDGNLYCESTASEGGETTDGKIPSIADGSEMSTENGQSNFGEESIINQTESSPSNSSTGTAETEPSQSEGTETVSGTVSHVGADETYTLNPGEIEQITGIIENGDWNTEGTADCSNNYKLTINEATNYYHSECGTLNDNLNNRYLTVTDAEKENINAVLSQYVADALEQLM